MLLVDRPRTLRFVRESWRVSYALGGVRGIAAMLARFRRIVVAIGIVAAIGIVVAIGILDPRLLLPRFDSSALLRVVEMNFGIRLIFGELDRGSKVIFRFLGSAVISSAFSSFKGS